VTRPRSSHYPLEVAMCDVVQRCLDAGARQVDVAVEFAGARSWIRVATDAAWPQVAPPVVDEEAESAITAPTSPVGLDVVSACLWHGAAVSVAGDDASGERRAMRWERHGDTAVGRRLHSGEPPAMPDDPARDRGRTVVLLDDLDEVLAYKRREGRVIETAVMRMRSRIADALGLAFHRPLAGAHPRRLPVGVSLNAEPVAPRDPLAGGPGSQRLHRRELPFVVDGRVETVVATPYVLDAVEDDPVAGRQGFFAYVRDRLVQAGGWSRLTVEDRGDAIARIAVDVPPSALNSFVWEPAPRRVLFPGTLAPVMRAVALEAVNAAVPAARGAHDAHGAAARAGRR
jgi:hypothetical protein